VLARPHLLRGEDELGYLLRALRNTLISQRRAESRRPATTELVDDAPLETRPSDDPAEATETLQCTPRSPSCRRSSGTRSSPSTSLASPIRTPHAYSVCPRAR
jgi:DNA-directed RNA polymerase specialized sigma24 family protein